MRKCKDLFFYWIAPIAALLIMGITYQNWAIVAILMICVTITCSDVTVWADRLRHPVFNWLGVFSYSLYLGHGYWSNALADLLPKLTYWQRMPVYLLISFTTGLFIHFTSIGLRHLWAAKGTRIKHVFVKA